MGSAITEHGTKCGSTKELSVEHNRQDNSHGYVQNWFPHSLAPVIVELYAIILD